MNIKNMFEITIKQKMKRPPAVDGGGGGGGFRNPKQPPGMVPKPCNLMG